MLTYVKKIISRSLPQPKPRRSHCVASVGRKLFLWGGRTNDFDVTKEELRAHITSFDSVHETWQSEKTTGELPPGLFNGACAASSDGELFHYGGWDGERVKSLTLSRFSPATCSWALLCKDSADGPMAKIGCGMVSFGDRLCVFAGGGSSREPKQPGSTLNANGFTNEVHFCSTNEGVWSSPALTGTRPCPRAFFTFTAINDRQAVVFAGYDGYKELNDSFLIDFQRMEWCKLHINGELPTPRWAHAACCLNFGDNHPQLLVTGGRANQNTVLDDAWILDVKARTWRKVNLSQGPRADHSLTAIAFGERVTEVISFGGWCKWPENFTSYADLECIGETTLLCFECPLSANYPSKWVLTDITYSHQLGSKEKVTAKKELLAKLYTRHSRERRQAQGSERQLQEAEELTHQLQQLADVSERREQEANRRAEEATARIQQFETQAQVAERGLEEATARATLLQQQTEQRVQTFEARLQDITEQLRNVRADADRRVREANRQLIQSQASSSSWVVQHAEVEYTSDPELGRGGWAAVKVAMFRGLRVAAKCPYDEIISDYNRQMFVREMNMAARLRHPNLMQFIGATIEGRMVILTELLPTSLRALFRQGPLSKGHITSISLDVARALNYLHLMRPDPIVHRDISSANVLLEPGPNNSWKAKVSDYGSVNLQQHLRTTGAGSPVYAAPEANYPDQQSPKMDVFSFGVLLVEMCTAQFPEVSEREAHIFSIPHAHFVALIHRCLQVNKDNRPTASDLITELTR